MNLVTFMGLAFETSADVLIPREETEILARAVLELLPEGEEARVIDMCCGSANLACVLAATRPNIRVWASDLTDPCVALARRNVARHALDDRVQVRQGDLFASLDGDLLQATVDLVVCNPPYISTGKLENDSAHLLVGQPREAFDGGPYGFAIHKRVIQEAPRFLKPGRFLAMEIGLGQERQIEALFHRTKQYQGIRTFPDEKGSPRVVAARFEQTREAE